MTIKEAICQISERLGKATIPDARIDAEYLVAAAAGVDRLRLVLEATTPLTPDQEQCLARSVQERLLRKPLAYVLGEQPFMDLSLEVTPSVLIPRPETELLVEMAESILNEMSATTVVDVGTGSGNIALSLVRHPHVAQLYAIDISPQAINQAQQNALRNHINQPVHWIVGDLLAPLIQRRKTVDVIVANLPYVRRDEFGELSPEVRWEPALALDGGRNGLAYIASLVEQAKKVLRPNGFLLLEIGADQGQDVMELLKKNRVWSQMQLIHDLAGHPRIVRAQKEVLVASLND